MADRAIGKMNRRRNFLLWILVGAAAGTAAGMLSSPRRPGQAGLVGGAAGILVGTAVAAIHQRVIDANDGIGFYSNSSPLYWRDEDLEYL